MKRTDYYPENAAKISHKNLPIEVYIYQYDSKAYGKMRWSAVGFHGKQRKPDIWEQADTRDELMSIMEKWWKNAETIEERATHWADENKARKNAPAPQTYIEGTIIYTSWGYEQTNVDFYKIVSRKGMTATIVAIGSESNQDHGWMSGTKSAAPDREYGEPFRMRITKYNGKERASIDGHGAYIWEGQPVSWSSYH